MKFCLILLGLFAILPQNKTQAQTAEPTNLVVGYKYWFNDIPSDARSIVLDTPTEVKEIELDIDASFLNEGLATLNIQFRDARGQWSSVLSQPFNNIVRPLIEFKSDKTTICSGQKIQLENNSKYAENYRWELIDKSSGKIAITSLENNPEIDNLKAGQYSIKLVATRINGGKTDSLIKDSFLTIVEPKKAEIIAPEQKYICGKQGITLKVNNPENGETYQWFKNNQKLEFSEQSELNVQLSGSYSYAILDKNGCTSESIPVDLTILSAEIGNVQKDLYLCPSETRILSAEMKGIPEGTTFQWLKNGVAIDNATSATLNVKDAGIYSLSLSHEPSSCITLSSKPVKVDYLSAQFSNAGEEKSICIGKTFCMKASNTNPKTSYQWKMNGVDIAGANSSEYCASKTGKYTLLATSATGCKEVFSQDLKLFSNPVIWHQNDSIILGGQYAKIQWFVNGVKIANATKNILVCHFDGIFTVEVVDLCGNKELSDKLNYEFTSRDEIGQFNLTIYPNPTHNILNLSFPNGKVNEFKNIKVINQLGQEVLNKEVNINNNILTLDVSKLPSGVYFIETNTETEHYKAKFVKE